MQDTIHTNMEAFDTPIALTSSPHSAFTLKMKETGRYDNQEKQQTKKYRTHTRTNTTPMLVEPDQTQSPNSPPDLSPEAPKRRISPSGSDKSEVEIHDIRLNLVPNEDRPNSQRYNVDDDSDESDSGDATDGLKTPRQFRHIPTRKSKHDDIVDFAEQHRTLIIILLSMLAGMVFTHFVESMVRGELYDHDLKICKDQRMAAASAASASLTDRSIFAPNVTQNITSFDVSNQLNVTNSTHTTDSILSSPEKGSLTSDIRQFPDLSLVSITWLIPVFAPHKDVLIQFLRSAVAFCPTCCSLPILLIVGPDEIPLFTQLVVQNPLFAHMNFTLTTLPAIGYYWQQNPGLGFNMPHNKYVIQSLKKMHGCASRNTTFCWITDAESLFVRPTSVSELLHSYIQAPFVVGSSWVRHQGEYGETDMAAEILGIRRRLPWMLEVYFWLFESSVMREIESKYLTHFPTLDAINGHTGSGLFIEVVYNCYLYQEYLTQGRFSAYRFYDSHDFVAAEFWQRWKRPWHASAELEEIAVVWTEEAKRYIPEAWSRYHLRVIRCGTDARTAMDMVERIPSLRLCLSDQTQATVDKALRGDYIATSDAKS